MVMELGKGPCVKFRDVGMISDPRVVDWMIQSAEKAKIPYQREVLLIGSTDAQRNSNLPRRRDGGRVIHSVTLCPLGFGDGGYQ